MPGFFEPLFRLGFRSKGESSAETSETDSDLGRVDDNASNRSLVDDFARERVKRHLIVRIESVKVISPDGGGRGLAIHDVEAIGKGHKAVEMAGWDYPKHLSNRVYGFVVHGDVAGIEKRAALVVGLARPDGIGRCR